RLDAAGTSLLYSTYIGGSAGDSAQGIAVDGAGAVYVTGFTGSTDFPTANAMQATLRGLQDAFVLKIADSGGGPPSFAVGPARAPWPPASGRPPRRPSPTPAASRRTSTSTPRSTTPAASRSPRTSSAVSPSRRVRPDPTRGPTRCLPPCPPAPTA